MLRNTRKGFTLIELLIVVVIIGILASIAIPKFASTKDKARVASMKTDLRNLVSLQEGHIADHLRYAIAVGAVESPTTVVFFQTTGNTLTLATAQPTGGWSATITRSDLAVPTTCGIYLGTQPSPNAAIANEGEIACWSGT